MAYMNSERKAALAPAIKKVLAKYKVKATLGVRNHSTLVINISQGKLDFIGVFNRKAADRAQLHGSPVHKAEGHIQVNSYYLDTSYDGKELKFLEELSAAANVGNHDRSDLMTDYFDVGFYVDINVGRWNKPYALVK